MKKKVSITLDDELVVWLDNEVKNKTYASRSHGCTVALNKMRSVIPAISENVEKE